LLNYLPNVNSVPSADMPTGIFMFQWDSAPTHRVRNTV